MSKQITIIFPDNEDTYEFTIEFSDAYGEVYNVEGADTLEEALTIIKEKELTGDDDENEDDEDDEEMDLFSDQDIIDSGFSIKKKDATDKEN